MNQFAETIRQRRIIVCVGSGGVGKTTTSAIIGLNEALAGRRVLVLTIDPARRLANALGLESLTTDMARVPLERFPSSNNGGELWAMMLDMKDAFDHVVRKHAPDESRDEILNNRIYKYFSTSLAGTQEYAAAEKLYELYEETDFDLIVLDTPPTTHALDFLEAPNRLGEAVDSKALQWIYKPSVLAGKKGLGIFSKGTSYVMKILGMLTGQELLDEFATFLKVFSTLFDGLRDRSAKVREVLLSDESAFIVVTSPDPLTIEEASYFHKKLGRERAAVGGFVVNRVRTLKVDPEDLNRPAVAIAGLLTGAKDPKNLAKRLMENGRAFSTLADIDQQSIARLKQQVDEIPVRSVPYFGHDIHDLIGLERARSELFKD